MTEREREKVIKKKLPEAFQLATVFLYYRGSSLRRSLATTSSFVLRQKSRSLQILRPFARSSFVCEVVC